MWRNQRAEDYSRKFRTAFFLFLVQGLYSGLFTFLFNEHIPGLLALGAEIHPQGKKEEKGFYKPIAVQLKVV